MGAWRTIGSTGVVMAALVAALMALAGCGSDQPVAVGISPASAAAGASITVPTDSATPTPSGPDSVDPTAPSSSAAPGRPSRTPRPTPTTTAPASYGAAAGAQEVASIVLRSTDAAVRGPVQPVSGGEEVADHATFELCGFVFTTEDDRVARTEVSVGVTATSQFSNEVVAYRSVAAATLALHEFGQATTTCVPGKVVAPAGPGEPFASYAVSRVAANLSTLAVMPNIVAAVTVTPTSGAPTYYALTYQQRGNLVDGTYLESTRPPTAPQLAALGKLANASGKRLAEVPAS